MANDLVSRLLRCVEVCVLVCRKDPMGAIKLCLNAAKGCSAKARAWNWADDATNLVAHFYTDNLSDFKMALGEGRYPNIQEALKLLPND